MSRLALLVLVAACSGAPPARHEDPVAVMPLAPEAAPEVAPPASVPEVAREPVPPPFVPTAFGVEVRGRGRPVILIPGLGCPPSVWDSTIAHFGDTVETHTLSLAGFAGRAPLEPAVDRAHLNATVRAELVQYIRERKLERPVVIGHSLGGFIAYWLAATAPELVGPVIVVDAAPDMLAAPVSVQARADRWRRMTNAQFVTGVREYFEMMAVDKAKLAPVIAAVVQSDRRTFVEALVELATVDLRPQLASIAAPVLVIIAEGKRFAETVARQTAAIRDRKITVLENTRHFVFFDDPTGFFGAVDEFLAAHPHGTLSP